MGLAKSYQTVLHLSKATLLTLSLGFSVPLLAAVAAETESTTVTEQETIEKPVISAEQKLHTALILTALKVDFYNARCRGLSVAKNVNKVNRLYITKYSITANNYIKIYISEDVRKEKANQEIAFKKALSKIGGCSKAKQQGWVKSLRDEFNDLYEQAEKSTWYPEEL